MTTKRLGPDGEPCDESTSTIPGFEGYTLKCLMFDSEGNTYAFPDTMRRLTELFQQVVARGKSAE